MKKNLPVIVVGVIFLVLAALPVILATENGIEPNPELSESCGVDIVLVIDSSGSISNTELNQMKAAFEGFVNAFLPATPTLMGVVDFDTEAAVIQNFTDNVTTLITAVNAPSSGGYTNWEDALVKAHGMFDPRSDHPDLIIFASDGNPNRIGSPAQYVWNETLAVLAAVNESDSIKADGIRIITLGIGNNLDVENLESISSPDAVIVSDFDVLAEDLANLSVELCGGTITVRKLVDGVGASGWEFVVAVVGGNATPPSGSTDNDGLINFNVDLDEDNGTAHVIEIPQQGYSLESASCVVGNVSVGDFDGEDSVDNIPISLTDIVSCEFVNVLAGLCGDDVINQEGEECDEGENNTNVACVPAYGLSCNYCDTSCKEHRIEGPFCGDGTVNGPEECDGEDGVGSHQDCSQNCTLVNLTYCGDGTVQSPNDEGTGGPLNDGYEECDGTDGVGENEVCTPNCEIEQTGGDGCVLTQGYWKNHDWPDGHERDDTFFNSGKTWFEILKMPPKKGDAYIILSHQYIAYKLNQDNGAGVPDQPALDAEALLWSSNPGVVPKDQRENFIDLAELLDSYNNGLIGDVPHCDS